MKIYRINGEYRQTIPISDVLKMSARNFDEIPEVFFISDNYSGKCKRFGQIVEVAEACSNMDSNNNVFHTKYTITVEIGMDCVHLSPTEVFYTDIKDINFEPVTEYFECYEGNFSIDEYKRLIAPFKDHNTKYYLINDRHRKSIPSSKTSFENSKAYNVFYVKNECKERYIVLVESIKDGKAIIVKIPTINYSDILNVDVTDLIRWDDDIDIEYEPIYIKKEIEANTYIFKEDPSEDEGITLINNIPRVNALAAVRYFRNHGRTNTNMPSFLVFDSHEKEKQRRSIRLDIEDENSLDKAYLQSMIMWNSNYDENYDPILTATSVIHNTNADIIYNLSSNSTTSTLSAKQYKELNDSNLAFLTTSGNLADIGYKPSNLIQSNYNILNNPFFHDTIKMCLPDTEGVESTSPIIKLILGDDNMGKIILKTLSSIDELGIDSMTMIMSNGIKYIPADQVYDFLRELLKQFNKLYCYNSEYAGFKLEQMITKVTFSGNKATIITWKDKTVTKSICKDEDRFDKRTGILACVLKYILKKRDLSKNKYVKTLTSIYNAPDAFEKNGLVVLLLKNVFNVKFTENTIKDIIDNAEIYCSGVIKNKVNEALKNCCPDNNPDEYKGKNLMEAITELVDNSKDLDNQAKSEFKEELFKFFSRDDT